MNLKGLSRILRNFGRASACLLKKYLILLEKSSVIFEIYALVPRSAWNTACRTLRVPFRRRAAGCGHSTRSVERELNSPAQNAEVLKTSAFWPDNTYQRTALSAKREPLSKARWTG